MKLIDIDMGSTLKESEYHNDIDVNKFKKLIDEASIIEYEMQLEELEIEKQKLEGFKKSSDALKKLIMRYDGKYSSWRELLAKMRSDLYKVEINEEKRVKEKELANKLAEAEKKIEEMKEEKQREKEKCMEDKINELTMKLDRLSIVSRTGPRRPPKCFG
ncbi:hypothetical protein HERIO_1957 [Hepatospora eriocheir]|uniref:Uncharacterized protein n=1 Tax=Hepatospora eriocheir TaxID=1081669 RepID=A0A1X0Q8Q3_9MICR|nr:hypothetical protein HERIO_1957 [Hepatospora eriocheir]